MRRFLVYLQILTLIGFCQSAALAQVIWEPGDHWGEKPKPETRELKSLYDILEDSQELTARTLIFMIEMDDGLTPARDLEKELGREPTPSEVQAAENKSLILDRLKIDFKTFFAEKYNDYLKFDLSSAGGLTLGGAALTTLGRSALRKGRGRLGYFSMTSGILVLVPAAVSSATISSDNISNGFLTRSEVLQFRMLRETLPEQIAPWDLVGIQKMLRLSDDEVSVLVAAMNDIAASGKNPRPLSGFEKFHTGDGKPAVRVNLESLLIAVNSPLSLFSSTEKSLKRNF